jgi:hypothetical protein
MRKLLGDVVTSVLGILFCMELQISGFDMVIVSAVFASRDGRMSLDVSKERKLPAVSLSPKAEISIQLALSSSIGTRTITSSLRYKRGIQHRSTLIPSTASSSSILTNSR